jgi:hypothetical protein
MKKLIVAIIGLAVATGVQAQGLFNLANGAPTVDAPIRTAANALLPSTGFWIQAYTAAGPSAAEGSLTPLGSPFRATAGVDGYFFNGSTAIPGLAAGTTASVQIRAWSDNVATYELAVTTVGSQIGKSGIVDVALVGGTTPTNDLTGLQAFQLTTVVPEPSVIAFAILGAGALFMRRRKS